ncbi:MAG: helix-turn-helix domain-containing protein [Collinsella sp.]
MPNVEVKESATTLSRDVWAWWRAFRVNTAEAGTIVLGVSERAGFVPVENFETEKVLNQFVAGMGDAGGRGKLANPPKYTIERVELQGVIVLVITIEELDPSSKPCYVIERGAQGGSYKRIDDKDVSLSSTEVLALASYGRATPSDRDAVAGAGADDLDETLVDRTIDRAFSLTPRAMRGAPDKQTKLERLNILDSQGNVTKAGLSLVVGTLPLNRTIPDSFIDVAVHVGTQKGAAGPLRFMDRTVCEERWARWSRMLSRAVPLNLRRTSDRQGDLSRDPARWRFPRRFCARQSPTP